MKEKKKLSRKQAFLIHSGCYLFLASMYIVYYAWLRDALTPDMPFFLLLSLLWIIAPSIIALVVLIMVMLRGVEKRTLNVNEVNKQD